MRKLSFLKPARDPDRRHIQHVHVYRVTDVRTVHAQAASHAQQRRSGYGKQTRNRTEAANFVMRGRCRAEEIFRRSLKEQERRGLGPED
eukprot:6178316-Pleurochrysis_carterae.AAC.2